MTHTYEHTFCNGTKATAVLQDAPPDFIVKWHDKPIRAILPEYFRWRTSILADFHERTGKKILIVTV